MPKKPSPLQAQDPRRFEIDRALLHRGSPATGWGNLGDWSRSRSYPEACEALAVRVGEAAHLGELPPGATVLEAACGEGEGHRTWLERFGVARVIGVEIHAGQAAAGRARLSAAPAIDPARWRLAIGSAVDLAALGVGDASVDAVVAVDAAYHFAPRDAFFREARRALRPGGRLAVTDLALASAPSGLLAESLVRGAAHATAIPRENMVSEGVYVERLRAAGFVDVAIERLDRDVLAGFAAFARTHRRAHFWDAPGPGWTKVLVTGWGAELVRRRKWIHYVLAAARVPIESDRPFVP
jgi:SAM-dependent methyltransferase